MLVMTLGFDKVRVRVQLRCVSFSPHSEPLGLRVPDEKSTQLASSLFQNLPHWVGVGGLINAYLL